MVIDIRANGGGDINNYVLLTKFLRKTPFKVADTAYSKSKNFVPFTHYISSGFFDNIGLYFYLIKKKTTSIILVFGSVIRLRLSEEIILTAMYMCLLTD